MIEDWNDDDRDVALELARYDALQRWLDARNSEEITFNWREYYAHTGT
jgi:hypothetical protein